jgi:hypothetical protein
MDKKQKLKELREKLARLEWELVTIGRLPVHKKDWVIRQKLKVQDEIEELEKS